MIGTFFECTSLKSLDLRNFKTPNLIDTFAMFYEATSLEYINLENLNTTNVINMESMFNG